MLSDDKTKTGDTLPAGGQSSAAGGSSPSTQPEVFTKEQVAERHSKLDKTIAELTRANQTAQKAVEAANAKAEAHARRLADIEEQRERDELNSIKENPDALSVWQGKQALREERREFEAKQATLEQERSKFLTDLEEVKTWKTYKSAMEIVGRPEYAGVSADKLVDLTDGSPEKMEALAKLLKAGMGQPGATVVVPDSGKSTGGAGEPTQEELDAMPMDKYAQWWNERQKKR